MLNELYQEIEVIKESDHKRIVLVRSKIDHLLYLKRELPVGNKNIYYQLKQSKIKNIPQIYHLEEDNNKLIVI